MIILSINIRGLGNPSKKNALGRQVDLHKLDIVLIQETMGEGKKLIRERSNLMKDWEFLAVDALERFGFVFFVVIFPRKEREIHGIDNKPEKMPMRLLKSCLRNTSKALIFGAGKGFLST
jgi:exonuclease III